MCARRRKYKRPRNERMGNMFLTLSIIALILGVLPIVSKVAAVAYYVVIGIIIVGTIGLVMLIKEFRESFSSGEETFNQLAELIKYSPYVLSIAAVLAFIATIIYAKSKTLRKKGGNVTAGVIFTILPIIIAIVISRQ